jgi:hypothetical protein
MCVNFSDTFCSTHQEISHMATLRGLLLGALVFTTIACSGMAPRPVITDKNSHADFRIYTTYRWFDGPYFAGNHATANESVYRALRDSVNVALNAAGLEWKQFEKVEMTLHMHAGMPTPPIIEQWTAYSWYKPWWGAFAPLSPASMYDPGTLVIDVIDAKRAELIWRALLPDCFTSDGSIMDINRLGRQLREAFDSFPVRRQSS